MACEKEKAKVMTESAEKYDNGTPSMYSSGVQFGSLGNFRWRISGTQRGPKGEKLGNTKPFLSHRPVNLGNPLQTAKLRGISLNYNFTRFIRICVLRTSRGSTPGRSELSNTSFVD